MHKTTANPENETLPNVLVGSTEGLHYVMGGRSRVELTGHEVRSPVRIASELWAIIDRREVWWFGLDDRWRKVAAVSGLDAICLLPTSEQVLVGTSEAHLWRLRERTLEPIPSFDEVESRNTWYNPAGSAPDVRSMSTDPTGNFYVNVHVGGIVRSRDAGKSWEPTIEVDADVHQVLYDAGSGLLLGASLRGLAISEDQGESWRFDTQGLHGTYLRAVAVVQGTVLVTASTGPFTDRAAVYRKPVNSRGPFERCVKGLPEWFSKNINTFNLAASDSCVAFGTEGGSVYFSRDEGRSWDLLIEGLPTPRCVILA